MKKVGIIDSYISNYHASTYFKLFHEIAEEENREEYVITDIYAVNDVSPSTNETTDQWCERTGAVKRDNIKDVVDNVDVIMVLAPNNPELHEELCELPGVGRKTANLTVAVGFKLPAICVDVHVHRICNWLKLINTKPPLESEMTLRKILPVKFIRARNLTGREGEFEGEGLWIEDSLLNKN